MNQELIVTPEDNGRRLDRLLADKLEKFSRTGLQRLIKDGRILVNDKKITPHFAVSTDDRISLDIEGAEPKSKPTALTPLPDIAFGIVYEDADVVVVNKPSGLLVHPSVRNEEETLANALVARYPEIIGVGESFERPGIVHRLDKDASGLLVIARTKKAYASSGEKMAARAEPSTVTASPDRDPPRYTCADRSS